MPAKLILMPSGAREIQSVRSSVVVQNAEVMPMIR